ncbi:MAG TPA: ParB/RepB/Spo0J family partition protein [Frankiaceae bacterium]|nr:ParB/RepB/Spo0J family partition protein [Frankiaceae bacterium]
MSVRQRGLGRGLGALIAPAESARQAPSGQTRTSPSDVFFNGPGRHASIDLTSPPVEPGLGGAAGPDVADNVAGQVVGELRLVPVQAIHPNPRQPRTEFDEDALDELTASIREVGVLQPIVVRPAGDDRYELVMGERRWRASQRAGLTEVPAVIRTTADDNLLREALLENLHRSQLNPLEEAAAYSQLLTDFGCTHEELAGRLGTSRSHLTNTMRLLNLSPAVQRRVAAGILTAGHARALLTLADAEAQDALATRIVAEGLSVRAVEELVAVGQPARRRRAAAVPTESRPELSEVAAALTERLDTRVKVQMGRSKGRITVEFAGTEDLQRILSAIGGGPTS